MKRAAIVIRCDFYYIYSDYLNINQIIQSNFINTNNFQLLIAAPDSD